MLRSERHAHPTGSGRSGESWGRLGLPNFAQGLPKHWKVPFGYREGSKPCGFKGLVEPEVGIEPTTCCLQDSCSSQLSYSGGTTADVTEECRLTQPLETSLVSRT